MYALIENNCPPCLRQMPGAQYPDPSPLPNVEVGYEPPTTYTSTRTMCAECAVGYENLSDTPLEWTHVGNGVTPFSSIYQLDDGPKIVRYFVIPQTLLEGGGYIEYSDLTIYGSNNGTTWTELLTLPTPLNTSFELKYLITGGVAYEYYKVECSAVTPTLIAPYVLIEEIEFYEVAPQSICKTATETSTVNQLDAEQKAEATALQLANDELNCVQVFSRTVEYTARCQYGNGADVSRSATGLSLNSDQEAYDIAYQAAKAEADADLDCTGSNNNQLITINDRTGDNCAPATRYPSVKYVTGGATSIISVQVSINGFTHTNPDDVKILLESPEGTTMVLMSGCGGAFAVNGVNLVIKSGAIQFPDATQIVSGNYRPTIFGAYGGSWPSPAPSTTGIYLPANPPLFSVFQGEDANGAWKLWVIDCTALDSGSIGSWDLTIT